MKKAIEEQNKDCVIIGPSGSPRMSIMLSHRDKWLMFAARGQRLPVMHRMAVPIRDSI